MKTIIQRLFPVLLLYLCALPAICAGETEIAIRTGLNATPGLFYNRSWDPGYNGTALTLSGAVYHKRFLWEAGLESGYSYAGLHLLIPVSAGFTFYRRGAFRGTALFSLMPGMLLNRPTPYFLFAAEMALRIGWRVSDWFVLSLSGGPRFTASPDYSARVAPLELLDLTAGLQAEFLIRRARPR